MAEFSIDWILLVLLGFGTGAYGVLVGAGGGFILGPALLLFFGIEPKIVAGTALGLVAINSISGAFTYSRLKTIDYRSGLIFAAAATPGSVVAPFLIEKSDPATFKIAFGVLLLVLSVLLAFKPGVKEGEEPVERTSGLLGFMAKSRDIEDSRGNRYRYRFSEPLAGSFNVILGFISSFFGTGGGFLRTPILVSIFSFPVQVAVATSIFSLSIYTTLGAATHIARGNIEWFPTFVFAGIGLVIGGQVGARIAPRIKGIWIMRLLLVVVLVLGVRLLIEGIQSS